MVWIRVGRSEGSQEQAAAGRRWNNFRVGHSEELQDQAAADLGFSGQTAAENVAGDVVFLACRQLVDRHGLILGYVFFVN